MNEILLDARSTKCKILQCKTVSTYIKLQEHQNKTVEVKNQYTTRVLNILMQNIRSNYKQYIPQLKYVAHPDMQCTSHYIVNFVKTNFITKKTINSCCINFNF